MGRVHDRILKQRFSRRRLLATAGTATAGAALVAACGGSSSPSPVATAAPGTSPTAGEGTPKAGGILHSRQSSAFPNFNPYGFTLAALAQGLFLGFTTYDHLWYVPTDTGEVIKFLATDIETISPQEIRVTMGEAFFHDKDPVFGRQVDSADVKLSIEKFADQIPFGFSWLHEVMERIDAPDPSTVVYHQNRPWAWFFTSSNAGSPWTSSILPRETIDDDEFLLDNAVGSGRWMLESHEAGTNVRLRKFPNWREPGLPFLDGIDWVFAPEDQQALIFFEDQQIDSIGGLNNIEIADLESRYGDRIVTSSDLSRSYRTLMLKAEPPFDNPDVRHAISLALDREEIRQVLNLGDGVLSGPLPPAHTQFVLDDDDPDLIEATRHDPVEAKRLLERASFPFDREFTLKYSNFGDAPDLAAVIAPQLREVGIKMNVPGAEDISAWLANTLGPGNFEMTSFTHLPYEDPSLPLSFYAAPNQMGYENAEVEAAFRASAEALDDEERIAATKEVQRAIIRDWGPMINLYSPASFGARWYYLKGVVSGRGSFGNFNSRAWLDK